MKILQVCPIFPPQPGEFASGVTQVVYNISKELISRGHEVEVYTTNALDLRRKIKSDLLVIDGIKVHYFPYIMHYYTFFLTPSLIPTLKRNLKQFDIVHIHDYRTFQAAIVAHYAKEISIPYVMQAHGSLPHYGAKQTFKRLYDILLGYRLLKNASRVIALTPMEALQYKNIGVNQDRIEIVPNGINLSEFDTLLERGQFKRKFGLSDSQQIILCLGRIHKIKGLDLVVKAFAQLSKNFSEVRLVIAGPDDGYLPALKRLIKELNIGEKVILPGPVYGVGKLEAYVDTDVYVLPSSYEIFGITVLEAMACGTPVITTDTCGIANWVNSHGGYSVPFNEDELRRVLLTLLTDDGLRIRFGQSGKKLVVTKFTWDKIVVLLEKLYRETVAKPVIAI